MYNYRSGYINLSFLYIFGYNRKVYKGVWYNILLGGKMAWKNNLGVLVRTLWYNGSTVPEIREAVLYSMKEFAKVMSAIKEIGKPYGVSMRDDAIEIHVFLDRGV